jgi:hypothetical protein
MDQNSTNGTDKRNWRERLGIGAKEMPRISEDFNPAPVVPKVATPTVKTAPMAPRAAPKAAVPAARPAQARPAAFIPAPTDPDALASKLKSQRDAAEKLAEQRVQAARQRAEAINVTAQPASHVSAKPKFSFAEEETRPAALPAAVQPQRAQQPVTRPPAARPPVLPPPQAAVPHMAPPRPQLGAGALPPRTSSQQPVNQQPVNQQPSYQPRQPLPSPPQSAYPPAYNPNQGYRPIDPATGYAPPPQYNPNQGFAPQPRQQQGFTPQQPRLQVPQRSQQPPDYGYESQRASPRLGNPAMRPPVVPSFGEADQDDIFEQPTPRAQRRATANDYQQAYREVESGYEEEGPKSRGPWILLSLLALALVVGFGSVWAYNNYLKPHTTITDAGKVPVVKAPDQPAKVDTVTPDTQNAGGDGTTTPSKKQIYDRIVGDREVLGGQIVPTEETPVQPANNSQPIPAPDATAPAVNNGTGDDGTPLPLPPPPGDTGQQGSLEPSAKGDQQDAMINPAAGASQAADSPSGDTSVPIAQAPVPGEQIAAVAPDTAAPEPKIEAASPEKVILETPAKKIVSTKLAPEKKLVETKPQKSLGAKPVVLVAPGKIVAEPKKVASGKKIATVETANEGTVGGLYGDQAVGAAAPGLQPAPVEIAPTKKRKSLFDLFKGDTQTQDAANLNAPVAAQQPAVLPPVAEANKIAAVEPAPLPTSRAFVAQLASFKSKAEATQEYKNLSAKHGAIISRYAPIVTAAQVAGTTRYRLSIGPMASADVASGVCQSLFAAGERDCLVHRQ